MALEVNQTDKYTPRVTGVYDIFLAEMRTKRSDNSLNKKAQQWTYDETTRALTPKLYPSKAMFGGYNANLIVYEIGH